MNDEIVKANAPEMDASMFNVVGNDAAASEKIIAPRYSYWKSVFRVFFKHKGNILLIALFVLMILSAIFVPMICKYDPYEHITDATTFNLSPKQAMDRFGHSFKWLLGTGPAGNSIMYNIFAGARTSLFLAIMCAAVNMTLGIIVGAVWGFSKRLDAILIPIYQIIANVPYILLVAVLVYIIGAGFWSMVFAMTVTQWIGVAFFFRTQVMIIRDREYSLASKCLGTPIGRIVSKNILPFLTSVIVTLLATEVPAYISLDTYMSFIGLGMSASIPTLGRMISVAQTAFLTYPWTFWPPVAYASLLTIILYLLGQSLADATDPKTHM
ncbi:MAG: ABC transporter permease [Clostridia bacterium]|nr:ABC transporter permease [Clostridia bacterium]